MGDRPGSTVTTLPCLKDYDHTAPPLSRDETDSGVQIKICCESSVFSELSPPDDRVALDYLKIVRAVQTVSTVHGTMAFYFISQYRIFHRRARWTAAGAYISAGPREYRQYSTLKTVHYRRYSTVFRNHLAMLCRRVIFFTSTSSNTEKSEPLNVDRCGAPRAIFQDTVYLNRYEEPLDLEDGGACASDHVREWREGSRFLMMAWCNGCPRASQHKSDASKKDDPP